MYRFIRNSNLPSWLKLLINIVLTLTVVYWLGYMIYKIVDIVRLFIHTFTEKKYFWLNFGIVAIALFSCCLYLQYNTDFKPFTELYNKLLDLYNITRNNIADLIHS